MHAGFIGEVHESLRSVQRQQAHPWPHQLTMARLVARALRLGKGALIQVDGAGCHRLSYVLPCLLLPEPVILCVPPAVRTLLLTEDIPWLQQHLGLNKPVYGDPEWGQQGLILTDPCLWLAAKRAGRVPAGIPVVIDGAEGLGDWVDQVGTIRIGREDWQALQQALPQAGIPGLYQRLLSRLVRRPLSRFPLLADEIEPLLGVLAAAEARCPGIWQQFSQCSRDPQMLLWGEKNQDGLGVTLAATPLHPAVNLGSLWQEQPLVLIGQGLDADVKATSFRQRFGLPDLTCLRFGPSWDQELPLWIPSPMPLPNTPQFQGALLQQVRQVAAAGWQRLVILISDQPLLQQLATTLASEWGSRVGLNRPAPLLVSSWEYWLEAGLHLPPPQGILVGTLPFPSMADPLVAGRVEGYKRLQRDWFREYLLPVALTRWHHSLSGLRQRGGYLGILDSRVLVRSYGQEFLAMLEPYVRVEQLRQTP
ncbi:MAG: hypothetical protein Q6K70_07875 [Thermostichales cyanobacterium DRC_bins_46]